MNRSDQKWVINEENEMKELANTMQKKLLDRADDDNIVIEYTYFSQ
jgi:hypothetical protein